MDDRLLERPLPHSSDAERAVLGSVMLNPALAAQAGLLLAPADFYLRAHQFVFRALLELAERGAEIDPLLLAEELRREGVLEQAGGMAFVSELTYGLPLSANIASYAHLIREHALSRQLIRVSNKIMTDALEGDEEARVTLAHAEEMLTTLSAAHADLDVCRPLSIAERRDAQARRHELHFRGVSDAVATGFHELDARLTGGGLRPKQFVILAARPSVGKSSLALDIAANVAASDKSVLLFSLEMGAEQLIERLEAYTANIERWKIRPGIYESDYRRLTTALDEVSRLPVWVDDTSRTVSAIRRHARELSRRPETRPALIVVDYLQLVDSEQRRGSRNDDVGAVSRALKGLAMELEVPVLALSQLSRDCEKQGREPELSDLRDSGELEQDADTVLFLFGNKPEEGATFYERTLKCAKQREGGLFRVDLLFNGSLVTFRPKAERGLQEIPFSGEDDRPW